MEPIVIKETPGSFYVGEQADAPLAEIIFSENAGIMTIEHTEVSLALKGQGVGLLLVEAAVRRARAQNLKIVSECSFASHVLRDNPLYTNVYIRRRG